MSNPQVPSAYQDLSAQTLSELFGLLETVEGYTPHEANNGVYYDVATPHHATIGYGFALDGVLKK